jgi:hypothetical protein
MGSFIIGAPKTKWKKKIQQLFPLDFTNNIYMGKFMWEKLDRLIKIIHVVEVFFHMHTWLCKKEKKKKENEIYFYGQLNKYFCMLLFFCRCDLHLKLKIKSLINIKNYQMVKKKESFPLHPFGIEFQHFEILRWFGFLWSSFDWHVFA